MRRIGRRRFLQLSGAAAASTGGLAAILATGRAPAYAQETTVHWLRWADFVPASDVLLKGPITQECKKATRHQAQGRDHQRQRSAVAHHLGDPVRHRRRHHHGVRQLAAALCREPGRRRRCRRGDRQGPGRLSTMSASRSPRSATNGSACRGAIGGGLIAYRKSWLAEAGSTEASPRPGTNSATPARS